MPDNRKAEELVTLIEVDSPGPGRFGPGSVSPGLRDPFLYPGRGVWSGLRRCSALGFRCAGETWRRPGKF